MPARHSSFGEPRSDLPFEFREIDRVRLVARAPAENLDDHHLHAE